MKNFINLILVIWLSAIITAYLGVFLQPENPAFKTSLILSMLIWGLIAGTTEYKHGWRTGKGGASDLFCLIFLNMVWSPITMGKAVFGRAYRGGGRFFPAPNET